MTELEKRAEVLWLESATFENDFKALSFEKLRVALKAEGFEVGSSTLARWSEKYAFKSQLQCKILACVSSSDEAGVVTGSGLDAAVKKTLVTVEKNTELIGDSFDILTEYMAQLKIKVQKKIPITNDEAKIVGSIYAMTSAREDKMLDRLTNAGRDGGLTAEEAFEAMSITDVEIEVDE